MRAYALAGGASEAREYPGVALSFSGLDVPVFNSAMLTGQTDDIERLIATADLHFQAKRAGWTFWVCEDLLPANMRNSALEDIFLGKGMRRIAEPPGMYADSIVSPSKPLAKMTFARVDSAQTRMEFAHLASVVFSLRFGVAKRIYSATDLWSPPSYGWIGYFEGKPVGLVTVVIAGGAAGIYSLGTLPQHQGCGFGETLLRHALDDARRHSGIECSVLQATTQGMSLYLRLGYRVVTKFSIYLREGCASF